MINAFVLMTFKSHYVKHSEHLIQYFTVVQRLFVYSSVKYSADLWEGGKKGKEKKK